MEHEKGKLGATALHTQHLRVHLHRGSDGHSRCAHGDRRGGVTAPRGLSCVQLVAGESARALAGRQIVER